MITYFIQSGEFVKIGETHNLTKRFKSLVTYSPVEPILLKACDLPEVAAHAIAAQKTTRVRGEWFILNSALLEWIDEIQDTVHETGLTPKKTVGRPRGITKIKISVTVDQEALNQAKAICRESGEALSSWVESAVRENLAAVTGGKP